MGIPKFFRWTGERYPLISQLIQENNIPEFDNLYLDSNGIIHNSCKPSGTEGDAHFRITEDEIFLNIFNYIEHLFSVIKPKKLFFIAIDGIAPRAKINQQRSRRFRTARDADELRRKAIQRGEDLPPEPPFDSNCITPGTEFMTKLTTHLQWFFSKKISEDANWRNVQVVLSGHESPGEGEHKIMEYIRLSKAQPNYDPNTRHCLYGLDADLIMLGLLSHDPHFALLREEVTFGPRKKKSTSVENTNFFLMHLSLLREYLDLEFGSLKNSLPFEYDVEKIIDDFILLAIFVGNDFLPHLPHLHIHEGALTLMFGIYKRVLLKSGGYINNQGEINLARLQLIFDELNGFEKEAFESEFADSAFYKGKKARKSQFGNKFVLTPAQKLLFEQVKKFVLGKPKSALHFPSSVPKADVHFVRTLATKLGLYFAIEYHETDGTSHAFIDFDSDDDDDDDDEDEGEIIDGKEDDSVDSEIDEESHAAIQRVLKKYDKAPVEESHPDDDLEDKELFEKKFEEWKTDYYNSKLDIDYKNDKEAVRKLAYRYIEGLQWVLKYYYSGVASWSWFYDYHYSPRITDLKNIADMKFHFDLGKPFLPFQQLMGVLPELSKKLVPEPYRDLMSDSNSPISDFYPSQFQLDLNGKKADWEAVVKIPFIDENRLIEAMETREHRLTEDERKRNTHGESFHFAYDTTKTIFIRSPSPGFFPDLPQSRVVISTYHLPTLEGGLSFKNHLLPGVKLGVHALSGFPSLKTLPHTGNLGFHGVNVFQQDSKNETIVIALQDRHEGLSVEAIAKARIEKHLYVNWPFLQEGVVVAVSDALFRYEFVPGRKGELIRMPHSTDDIEKWRRMVDRIERTYSKRSGTIIGDTEVIFHVAILKGLKRLQDGSMVKEFAAVGQEIEFAAQTTVDHVESLDARYQEKPAPPLKVEFPTGANIFFLGSRFYGNAAKVAGYSGDEKLTINVIYNHSHLNDILIGKKIIAGASGMAEHYHPSFVVSRKVGLSGLALSKLTASVFIEHDDARINFGLNLKFEAKGLKVLGYSRKGDNGWEYSDKAIDLILEYKEKFPSFVKGLDIKSKTDMLRSIDFFSQEDADKAVSEIKVWLKNKGVRDFDKVPLDAMTLDKPTVQHLERIIDNIQANSEQTGNLKSSVITNIPRMAVLRPCDSLYRLHEQKFDLGDRVVSTVDTGNVPIASRGTVISIGRTTVDVVFDEPFMSGNTLGDRCSHFRGMTLPFHTVLNLTQRHLMTSVNTESESVPSNGIWRQAEPKKAKLVNEGIRAPAGLYDSNSPRGGVRGRGRGNTNGRGNAYNNFRGMPARTTGGVSYSNAAQGQRNQMEQLTHDTSLLNLLSKEGNKSTSGHVPARGTSGGSGFRGGRGMSRGTRSGPPAWATQPRIGFASHQTSPPSTEQNVYRIGYMRVVPSGQQQSIASPQPPPLSGRSILNEFNLGISNDVASVQNEPITTTQKGHSIMNEISFLNRQAPDNSTSYMNDRGRGRGNGFNERGRGIGRGRGRGTYGSRSHSHAHTYQGGGHSNGS